MNATVTAAAIGVGGSVIVALAAFWANVMNTNKTTALTLRAVELTEQGQVTDRYTKAIEQLGSDKLDVRLGAIYALERVARDSPQDHPTVMEVLATFVREHSHEQWPPGEPDDEPLPDKQRETRADVQAAVTAIGRRNRDHDRQPINLFEAELPKADLTDADLTSAKLKLAGFYYANLTDAKMSRADLTGADLIRANISRADLPGADLTEADLTGANLFGADLTRATLTRANLTRANLTRVKLTGADLTDADLTGADLTGARYPETFPMPMGWIRDPDSGRLRRIIERH